MSFSDWRIYRGLKTKPKCLFCDTATKPTIILRREDYVVRGWRCPKCGFTVMHPHEIPKALEMLRAIAETS